MQLSALRGIYTPIVTPLTPDEEIDHVSLRQLIDFLIEAGIHGIWVMGTTGEFASFSEDERAAAVVTTVEHVRGRVPVVANVGDCATRLALRHARRAAAAGVDALALTPPYYYPSSMDELLGHFRAVKQAHPELPLLVYNIPQTVKTKMTLPATLQLAREGTTSGIKDSQNDLTWFRTLTIQIREAGLEERYRMFLGTRTLIDSGVTIGAHGAIPATSNVAPRQCVEAFMRALAGEWAQAHAAQEQVVRYEELSTLAAGGSPNAASLSSMKELLKHWGVLPSARVSAPLRPLADGEIQALIERADALGPHVAVAA